MIKRKIEDEWLFFFSLLGVVLTSIYLRRFPKYSLKDFKIVYTLFIFLVLIKGLERSGFLMYLAYKFQKGKFLPQKLIFLTSILSMFITNDVALLTIVPLTLKLKTNGIEYLVILEIITANGISALTPFGNPQNIFIYFYYHLHPAEFIEAIAPFVLTSFTFVVILSFIVKISFSKSKSKIVKFNRKTSSIYLIFFLLFILAILKLLSLWIGIFILTYVILLDRKNLKIDYFLLATFLTFFGFTDNLMKILRIQFKNNIQIFLYSALASQLMSNVPSALFFADFTSNWKPLLWGVSVGGFGNLIGSLASLISYRLYKSKFPTSKKFLIEFHLLNYIAFFLGITAYSCFYIL